MPLRLPVHSRRTSIVIACILFAVLTVTVVITAVAAQNTGVSAKPTVLRSIAILPPEKQTAAAIGQTKTTEYTTAHPEAARILPTQSPSPLPLGIQDKYPNGWHMKQRFENEWFGYLNGERISVYAGSVAAFDSNGRVVVDPPQGYIAVGVGSALSGPDLNYHEYPTPKQSGAVKITAVNGALVTVVANDGTTFTFNLDTRTFQ